MKTVAFNRAIHNYVIDKSLFENSANICIDLETDMAEFLRAVCYLEWQMCMLSSQMHFTTDGLGAIYDETFQELKPTRGMDSSKIEEMKVQYYFEPTLMHQTHVMKKGRVVVQMVTGFILIL